MFNNTTEESSVDRSPPEDFIKKVQRNPVCRKIVHIKNEIPTVVGNVVTVEKKSTNGKTNFTTFKDSCVSFVNVNMDTAKENLTQHSNSNMEDNVVIKLEPPDIKVEPEDDCPVDEPLDVKKDVMQNVTNVKVEVKVEPDNWSGSTVPLFNNSRELDFQEFEQEASTHSLDSIKSEHPSMNASTVQLCLNNSREFDFESDKSDVNSQTLDPTPQSENTIPSENIVQSENTTQSENATNENEPPQKTAVVVPLQLSHDNGSGATDRPADCQTTKPTVAEKTKPNKKQEGTAEVIAKPSKRHRASALVEDIDYKLLEGKEGVDLLTAIELQTNAHLSKMDFRISSSSDSNGNAESPRKARTRSVETVVRDPTEKRPVRKCTRRPRSVEATLLNSYRAPRASKAPKRGVTPKRGATPKPGPTPKPGTSQVPSSKPEHKKEQKEKVRDKHEHKTEHKSGSKSVSSSDRKKVYKSSIGIQARPSRDHRRHHLKLLEPRPALMMNGNFTYPPADVSFQIFPIYSKYVTIYFVIL